MGFPGGREETRDGTLLQTAIRETKEEIGIDIVSRAVHGSIVRFEASKTSGGCICL